MRFVLLGILLAFVAGGRLGVSGCGPTGGSGGPPPEPDKVEATIEFDVDSPCADQDGDGVCDDDDECPDSISQPVDSLGCPLPDNANDNVGANDNQNENENNSQPPPPQCESNADCADELFCNGEETCVQGNCVAGTDIYCTSNRRCEEGYEYCIQSIEDDDPPVCPPLGPIGPRDPNLGELRDGSTIFVGTDCAPTGWDVTFNRSSAPFEVRCCWQLSIEVPDFLSAGPQRLEIHIPDLDEPISSARFTLTAGEVIVEPVD